MIFRCFFSRYFFPLSTIFIYAFLYLPIIALVLFSFNNNEFSFDWMGFTTKWYTELFSSSEVWVALKNSLIVASAAVVLSLLMGLAIVFFSRQRFRWAVPVLFSSNLAIPEIVLAIGMLSLFSFLGVPIGLPTLIAGHTLIGLGYAVPLIYDRYSELDKRYTEASLDLGATLTQTLRRVIAPMMLPSLVASALLVFVVSFDDFVLAFFCAGASAQTLPLFIFSMIRSGASPVVSALSVTLLVLSGFLVMIFLSLSVKKMVVPK
ncbi:MAG: ABC transporter permease [Hydrogenophaga sp.]|nr:ABC transporter permease [Hydrogenophaga sp.]